MAARYQDHHWSLLEADGARALIAARSSGRGSSLHLLPGGMQAAEPRVALKVIVVPQSGCVA